MIVLGTTGQSLTMVMSGAAATLNPTFISSVDYFVPATPAITPIPLTGILNGSTPVTIVAAPAAGSAYVNLKYFSVRNADTAAVTLTVTFADSGGTNRILGVWTLAIGDVLNYVSTNGWSVVDSAGSLKTNNGPGRLLKTTVLTGGTSFTTQYGTTQLSLEMMGGGGGGGGCSSAAGAAAAGGGAAGAYAQKTFAVVGNTAYTYAIAAGGLAGANTAGTGGTGGDTTFTVGATTVTAKGGLGGVGSSSASTLLTTAGGAGVIATNGDINTPGQPGSPGIRAASATIGMVSGNGGSSQLGGGGIGRATTQGAGATATGYGGGGSGGSVVNNGGAVTGGAGAPGCIIVKEYS